MAGSAVVGILRVLLTANAAEYDATMKRVSDTAKKFSKDLGKVGREAQAVGMALTKTLTVPLLGLGAGAIKAAMDFESSFAGVRKTVEATEPEFAALAQGLRNMAKEIPVNVNELNKVAEAAGQLGIKKEDILQFTRTMADLGVTTNLTADEAATATAQIQNIFGAAGKDVDRFGATLVALGNAGASTERDIIAMGLRIAGAGHQVGLTQGQVLAFASSLSSVGINAEAGGGALSRVFLKINDAVASGGASLSEFARVAGMSAEQFGQAFRTDAAGATTAFIAGLARIKGEGENVNSTLEGLVGKNIIIKDTLLRASGAGSLLTDNLKLQAQAWKDNTALTKEADERYKTFASQITLAWNQVRDLGITIGTALIPSLKDLIAFMTPIIAKAADMATWFAKLPEPLRVTALGMAAVAAAAGPAIWGLGQIATAGSAVVGAFKTGSILAGVPAALRAIGLAAYAAAPQLAAFAIAAGSVVAIGTALRNIVGLYTDRIEQANLAAAQAVSHQRAMADASKIAGREITNLDEALAILRKTAADSLAASQMLVASHERGGAAAAASVPKVKTLADELATMRASVNGLTKEQWAQIAAGDKMGLSTKDLTEQINKLFPSLKVTEGAIKMATDRLDANAKAGVKATAANKDFAESVIAVQVAMRGYLTLPAGAEDSSKEIAEIRESMDAMASVSFNGTWVPFVKGAKDGGAEVDKIAIKVRLLASLKTELGDIFKSIPQTISQALVSGGGLGDAAKAITSQLGSNLAKLGATALGITGPWGQAIAGAIGALAPMISKLWGGPSAAVVEARKKVDEFQAGLAKNLTLTQQQEAGNERWKMTVIAVRDAYLATGRTAAEAEAIVRQLWNTDNPAAAAAAMETINGVLTEQSNLLAANTSAASTLFNDIMAAGSEGIPAAYRPAIQQLISLGLLTDEQAAKLRGLGESGGVNVQKMTAAMDVFKGRIESLGPAFKQAQIDETAGKYINAIQTMIDGGGDLGGILFDAKEELGELVAESLRSKTTLPANLKPWIDDLALSGNLIDANGVKITDVSGIKYGEAQKTEAQIAKDGWDKILLAIQALIDRINGPLNRAIENLPDEKVIDITYRERDDRNRGNGSDQGFAGGTVGRFGKWFGRFPASGFSTALHGMEAVVTPNQAPAFAADVLGSLMTRSGSAMDGVSGGGGMQVIVNAQGAVFPDYQSLDRLAQSIARAFENRMSNARLTPGFAGVR